MTSGSPIDDQVIIADTTFTNNTADADKAGNMVYNQCGVFNVNHSRIFSNLSASTSVFNSLDAFILDATYNWWGAEDGPSGSASGSGDAISTNVAYIPFYTEDILEPEHEGENGCKEDYAASDSSTSLGGISLQEGEKRYKATHLEQATPVGMLAFTQIYRQSKQDDSKFSILGSGWSHNHNVQLHFDGDLANIYLNNGGILKLEAESVTSFKATTGSNAVLTQISPAQWNLSFPTGQLYRFEQLSLPSGATLNRLESLQWPNGDTWHYNYFDSPDNHLLQQVYDDYGNGLQFAYQTLGDQSLLYRVGDLQADLSQGTGNFIQFSHVQESLNGQTIARGAYLLQGVQDVMGGNWSFDYYGQQVGEMSAKLKNLLRTRQSPEIFDLDEGTSTVINLERLSYSKFGDNLVRIYQQLGNEGFSTTFNFRNFEVDGRLYTQEIRDLGEEVFHYFDHGVYAGFKDELGNETLRTIDSNLFRVLQQVDANGTLTEFEWSLDGEHLKKFTNWLSDTLSRTYQLEYNSNGTVDHILDSEGRQMIYSYEDVVNNPRKPTKIQIMDEDGVSVLRQDEFQYDTRGRVTLEQTVNPQLLPSDPNYVLQKTEYTYRTTSPGKGLVERWTRHEVGENGSGTTIWRHFTYDNAGRVISIQDSSTFGACKMSFNLFDAAGQRIASICNYNNQGSAPTTIQQAVALYNPADPAYNQVTVYTYDTLGRLVRVVSNAGTAHQQTNRLIYDSMNRIKRIVETYVPQGNPVVSPAKWIWDTTSSPRRWKTGSAGISIDHGSENNENIITDFTYNKRGLLVSKRDMLGRVALFGYDKAGRRVKVIQNASQADYLLAHPTDKALANYVPAPDADQDIVNTFVYDKVGHVVQTQDEQGNVDFAVYDKLKRLTKQVWGAKDEAMLQAIDPANDPRLEAYMPSTAPDRDLIEEIELYDLKDHVIQTKRLVENRGETIWMRMRYVYDALGRPIRTIASYVPQGNPVIDPAAWQWVNNRWEDGQGNLINHGPLNDQNLIAEMTYTPAGQLQSTLDVKRMKTWYVYDGLGRRTKTIVNYVEQGTPPSNPAKWHWLNNQWRDEVGQVIDQGPAHDQNIITEISYSSDSDIQSMRDVVGRHYWSEYDPIGRLKLSITNYSPQLEAQDPLPLPSTWSWDAVDHQWEGTNPIPPTVVPIPHGEGSDLNIVGETTYNAQDLVHQVRDTQGNVTRYVYDKTGRLIRSVENYVPQGTSDPADWEWVNNRWEDGQGIAINHGTDAQAQPSYIQNRITTHTYDVAGRVIQTVDTVGQTLLYLYDRRDRLIRTITNYSSYGWGAPEDWFWDGEQWVVETGVGVNHGDGCDQNLITDMAFNKAGQIIATRDSRGTETQYNYDAAGRQIQVVEAAGTPLETQSYVCYNKDGHVLRTIQNRFVDPADPNPPSPDEKDSQGEWVFSPVTHGPNSDLNLIQAYEYDAIGALITTTDTLGFTSTMRRDVDGQIEAVTDPSGSETRYIYDALRRPVRVVQNYKLPNPQKIVYWKDSSLYSMDPDGSNPKLLISGVQDAQFDLSPDGSSMVFLTYPGGSISRNLGTIQLDGSQYVEITHTSQDERQPAWSPMGDKLLAASNGDICTIHADGSNLTYLTNWPGDYTHNWHPAWSSDGSKIAFLSRRDGGSDELYVMNADGTNQTRLTFNTVHYETPIWSPDDTQIAYNRGGQIYLMNTNGTNQHRLTTNLQDFVPVWSPDGSWIVFVGNIGGQKDIYLINPDGTNQVRLTFRGDVNTLQRPSWSPDGTQICFAADGEIWSVNADGSSLTHLATGSYPQWSCGLATPDRWKWVTDHWEDGQGQPIPHGDHEDQNIVVTLELDAAGRCTALVDPLHQTTQYSYDELDRRTSLTNALNQRWEMSYSFLPNGGMHSTLLDPDNLTTHQDFDPFGRISSILYDEPSTPDVTFGYDLRHNLVAMVEKDGTTVVRHTGYDYDQANRVSQVGFNVDVNGIAQQSVTYAYDLGGLRTRLSVLPDDVSLAYTYNQLGQLTGLSDWTGQQSRYVYDLMGRLVAAEQPNSLSSHYTYDAGNRLRKLQHTAPGQTLGHFAYELDALGNRTKAFECIPHPGTASTTIDSADPAVEYYQGQWNGGISTDFTAALRATFLGDEATLLLGTGPDYGLCDIYINEALWRSFDTYAATAGTLTIVIPLESDGPHTLDLRNRAEHHQDSTGFKLQFISLLTNRSADLQTIQYQYDDLSRLRQAEYHPAAHLNALASRRYSYTYDRAGNRRSQKVMVSGANEVTTSFGYNVANQLISDGTTSYGYDGRGNLTQVNGVAAYSWDRANRLLSNNNVSYAYNGLGQRLRQTANGSVTDYLLDAVPGLELVLATTKEGSTTRYIYDPFGNLQSQYHASNGVQSIIRDGLESIRGVVNPVVSSLESRQYAPYGTAFGAQGTPQTAFGFTGEMTDPNGLVYLRARYYDPTNGIFLSRDPVAGVWTVPMSLNGYSYVHGNPTNWTDPSGEILPIIAAIAVGAALGAGISFTFEWGSQVYHNMKDCDMSFWHAVGAKNLDWGKLAGAAVIGGIEGGIFGGLGYGFGSAIKGLGFKGLAALSLELTSDVSIGMAWDIAVHGDTPTASLGSNLFSFWMGTGFGYADTRLRGSGTPTVRPSKSNWRTAADPLARYSPPRVRTIHPEVDTGLSLRRRRVWYGASSAQDEALDLAKIADEYWLALTKARGGRNLDLTISTVRFKKDFYFAGETHPAGTIGVTYSYPYSNLVKSSDLSNFYNKVGKTSEHIALQVGEYNPKRAGQFVRYGTGHAERVSEQIYTHLSGEAPSAIGISNTTGLCPRCTMHFQQLFSQKKTRIELGYPSLEFPRTYHLFQYPD